MIRNPFFSFFCIGICFTLSAMAQSLGAQTATHWQGTLNAGGNKLRMEVTIEEKEEKLSGVLFSVDQGNAKLNLDDVKLNEKVFEFAIENISATYKGTFQTDGSVKGIWQQGPAKFPLDFTKSKGGKAEKPVKSKLLTKKGEVLKAAWSGELDMGAVKPVMQFRIVTTEDKKTKAYFDSVTEGATGFEATWSEKDGELNFDVKDIRLTYRGKLNEKSDEATGTWSQGGREFPLTLKKSKSEFNDPFIWENRPQKPKAPFPYKTEEVTFENKKDNVKLAGSLTIPKGEGRFPVMVLISGSGPQDRDETLMGHKPFLVIADYLSRRGIAVLRYDDRGSFKSTGKFSKATTEDFAEDTSAAVDFLRSHPQIDKERIGLIGHSEGGLIAPMVAVSRNDIAAIISLAGPGIDGIATSLTQSKAMSAAAGAEELEIEIALAFMKATFEVVKKTEGREETKEKVKAKLAELVKQYPEDQQESATEVMEAISSQTSRFTSAWFRFFLQHDPAKVLAKVECPILVVIGEKDLQVLPKINLEVIKKVFAASSNKEAKALELPGLNHLFQECETGSMSEYKTIQETFNEKALQMIGDWCTEKLDVKK